MTSERFDHSFDGWSVWVEPCPDQSEALVREIELLADQCGGSDCGVHPFVPHCTLLYNVSPLVTKDGLSKEQMCSDLLNECVVRFQQMTEPNDTQDYSNQGRVQLCPTSFYYFPYPKHADNGLGFGCAISMILLERTRALQMLYESVRTVFPPDEREEFIPHVSLVYAPESRGEWLRSLTSNMNEERIDLLRPFRARYLSLWSTQGEISDWRRICRVELS